MNVPDQLVIHFSDLATLSLFYCAGPCVLEEPTSLGRYSID
jgi:hypothetical protein